MTCCQGRLLRCDKVNGEEGTSAAQRAVVIFSPGRLGWWANISVAWGLKLRFLPAQWRGFRRWLLTWQEVGGEAPQGGFVSNDPSMLWCHCKLSPSRSIYQSLTSSRAPTYSLLARSLKSIIPELVAGWTEGGIRCFRHGESALSVFATSSSFLCLAQRCLSDDKERFPCRI